MTKSCPMEVLGVMFPYPIVARMVITKSRVCKGTTGLTIIQI